MNFEEMTIQQLEERRSAIREEIDLDGADLDALEAEARAINGEIERRKAENAKKNEIRAAVAAGEGVTIAAPEREERTMPTVDEIRATKEYANAYANYIKTGDDKECRALLTMNVTGGTVPVAAVVDGIVRTAWDRDQILSRARRTYIRGNLRVPFEISASGAVVHVEGEEAPEEEQLVLGIAEMKPENIKKWITISDEAMALGGEDFLQYVYDEIVYQIIKKAAAEGVDDIVSAPAASTATAVGVPVVTAAPSVTAIPTAAAQLSDEAENVVVIMNRLTEADFIAAYAAGNFAVDPFAGMTKVYTTALKAYSAAASGDTYAIVGDLNGLQFNFPEGEEVVLKFDDLSLAEKDLVKVVGRLYAAHAVTAPGRFAKLVKA